MSAKLTKDELRLILFWRVRCHDYGNEQTCNTCLLYSLPNGTAICHKLTKKLEGLFQKSLKKRINEVKK